MMFSKEWFDKPKPTLWQKIRLWFIKPKISVDMGNGDSKTIITRFKVIDGKIFFIDQK